MPDFNDIYERMRMATGCRTQMELADVLEIRQSSISDAKRRDSVPGDWYMKLFDRFGLNPDWLKQGVGPLYLRANGQYGAFDASAGLSEQAAAFGEPRTKGQLVSVYDMRCDYSDRKARPALTSQRSVCLPMSCLGEKTVVLEMAGDNMRPVVTAGALLGVDTGDASVVSGKLYALFAPHEGLIVRRIFLDESQSGYLLRSEAPEFPETHLQPDALAKRLFGRIVWIFQELA